MTTEFSDQALREASEWYARLHSGEASAQDHVRLAEWLATESGNRLAYRFVSETGRLAADAWPASSRHRVPAPARRAGRRGGRSDGLPIRRRRWAMAGASAAAAAVVAGVGIAIVMQPQTETYETAVGEIRDVTLSDGSALVLNGATRLTVNFTRQARNLDIETGELFVSVGKDLARPFRVHAKGRIIEDVGTAFDVDTNGAQVDVAVSEGTVMISDSSAGGTTNPPIVLNKGQALTFAADRQSARPRTMQAQDVGTWRLGILSYDNSALEWLIADLNRRFDGAIAIADPELAAMPITLTLKLHDRDTTIGTLEKLLPVRAVVKADGSVELVGSKS